MFLEYLSIIISEFDSLSEFSPGIDRLYSFLTAIQELDPDCSEDTPLMSMAAPTGGTSSEYHQGDGLDDRLSPEESETITLKKLTPIVDKSVWVGEAALSIQGFTLVTPNSHIAHILIKT